MLSTNSLLNKISLLFSSSLKEDAEQGTPDLTFVFIILACVLVAGFTVYVIVRMWLHAKHEQAVLNRGLRAGIPNIKALNNDLPANSLNTLHDEAKKPKKQPKEDDDDYYPEDYD